MFSSIIPQATQDSLIALETIYPGSISNHRSVAVEISGPIDEAILKTALNCVVKRHEMLRARIMDMNYNRNFICSNHNDDIDSLPFSSIDARNIHPVPDVRNLPLTLKAIGQHQFIEAPFNLQVAPLWRCTLIKFAEDKYQFTMLFNHIIVDESSIGIILTDLSTYYNELINDSQKASLVDLPSLSNCNFEIPSHDKIARLQYWKETLANLNTINLQTDLPLQNAFKFNGHRQRFTLEQPLITRLKQLGSTNSASLNQIITASLYALLHRYSGGETDICLGITSANRRHQHIKPDIAEKLVNCLFNSIPLRLTFSHDTKFTQLITQVKNKLGQALKNQLPLDVIFREALSSDTKSGLNKASPFNVLLVVNNKKPTLTFANTTSSHPIELDLGRSKFPYFGINLDELENGSYEGFVEYNTDLFNEKTIARLIGHFASILDYVSYHSDCQIANIPFMLAEEKQLISDFNHSHSQSDNHRLVHDYLQKIALFHPNKTALVFHHEHGNIEKITYEELDIASTRLANYLKKFGVGPDIKVGISLSSSLNLIISILAILKVGGVVVTMETEACPALFHKIESANTAVVIVDNKSKGIFNNSKPALINLQHPHTKHIIASTSPYYRRPTITADHLAYIMYTSGTSGETPKGVMIKHGGFANLLNELLAQRLETQHVLCTATPTFDAFLFDLLVAFSTNGQLHLIHEKNRYSPGFIEKIIHENKITYGVFLPQTLDLLNPALPLNHVISMGAIPHEESLQRWAEAKPTRQIINGLGHTETGICLSLHQYKPGSDHLLVGKPIANMQMFILQAETYSLCPLGIPGEIFVAGPGLAAGYLNDEERTNNKFLSMSFDTTTEQFIPCDKTNSDAIRLYATGDYGCYQQLADNSLSIKFIGRRDRQLKLNGVRIELNAIETILRGHPAIKDVLVLPNVGNSALTSYIIPASSDIDSREMQKQIQHYLASTMLPSIAHPRNIILIDKFPLTENGKINTKELPIPDLNHKNQASEPLTELQRKLQQLWAVMLNRPELDISIIHSFKELGGDSLTLGKLEAELNKRLKFSEYITFNILHQHMTIAGLADTLQPYLMPEEIKPATKKSDIYIDSDNAIIFFPKRKQQGPSSIFDSNTGSPSPLHYQIPGSSKQNK